MRTGSLLRYSLAALAVVAATAAFPSASHAIVFDLTSDHCTGGCGTAPFGTVSVTQVGANVNFVVDLANGHRIPLDGRRRGRRTSSSSNSTLLALC